MPSTSDTGVMQERTGIAVDMHGAGAAGGNAAAVFRAGEIEMLAQDPQERRVGIDRHLPSLTVDGECSHERLLGL